MNAELEQKLVAKYPQLFAGASQPLTESLMAFGCECDDGWFNLISGMCAAIAHHLKFCDAADRVAYQFVQIKEKFGGLRVYDNGSDDVVAGIILLAETLSYTTCEVCGSPGCVCHAGNWFKTLCPACAKELQYAAWEKEKAAE